MDKQYNKLLKFVYNYSDKIYRKEAIDGLFCAVLEPLTQNKKAESCIFLRIFDEINKKSTLKRLAFSGTKIFNFGDDSIECEFKKCNLNNPWNKTEFLIVLSDRYSAALIWDYSDSEIKDSTKAYLLYNSQVIKDVAKLIVSNSDKELLELVKKYNPDRRENLMLNTSIHAIADMLNEKIVECKTIQYENSNINNDTDKQNEAFIVTQKSKLISHEIRNYLSIINLYSKISAKRLEQFNLADASILDKQEFINAIKNSIKNISNSSDNISYLINDLRCLATVLKKDINLADIVEESFELIKPKIEEQGVKFDFIKNKNAIVSTDKVKVECAITNIIFNALEANAKNITVIVNENEIHIKNDGIEISEEVQKHIFEENYTTKEHGNGIGLAFCKQQLNLINGDIILVSSDKNETLFKIKV